MKLRIRNRNTKLLELPDDSTLNDLHQFVVGLFSNELPNDYFLSLNKKDPISSSGIGPELQDVTLKDCNIVSGDLIHVVSLDPVEVNPPEGNVDSSVGARLPKNELCVLNCLDEPSTSGHHESQAHEAEVSEDIESMEEDPPIDHAIVNQCLSEPMLCRECSQGTVPPLLAKVYSNSHVTSDQEALIVALHILMLESGYIPIQSSTSASSNDDQTDCINEDWKKSAPRSYTLKYRHCSCTDKDMFSVVCVRMGGQLIIHGISPDKEDNKCHLTIKCSDYISSIKSNIPEVYENLPKLSMIFKDAISLPLLETYRQNHGYPVLSGLMSLSHEIKITIVSFLNVYSTVTMMSVCKDLQQVCRDRYLWRRLYLKDFGNRNNNDLAQDWYSIYKNEYRLRKQREKDRRRFQRLFTPVVPPMFRPPPDPGFPDPLPPYPPGIIGGDFDLFPQFNGPNSRRGGNNPLAPLQPRFDPIGPGFNIRPGRGGGIRDNRGLFGRPGPRFF